MFIVMGFTRYIYGLTIGALPITVGEKLFMTMKEILLTTGPLPVRWFENFVHVKKMIYLLKDTISSGTLVSKRRTILSISFLIICT
jgi:hypothetical protein